MGDRVLVQFKLGGKVSPVLYMHWAGDTGAAKVIGATRKTMSTRHDDLEYAFARAVFHACATSGGDEQNTGIGVWNESDLLTQSDSQGDGGIFIVDLSEYVWKVTRLDKTSTPSFGHSHVVYAGQ